jgi:hypothetical protein
LKRTALTLTLIIAFLFSATVGALSNVAVANPMPQAPPSVTIASPVGVVNSSDVSLSITVIVYGRISIGSELIVEGIKWVTYSVDRTLYHQVDVAITLTKIPTYGEPEDMYTGNAILSGLSDGVHGLTIRGESTFNNTISKFAYFTVDTVAPSVSVLSPENKTYNTTSIPLSFILNETASNMSFSLDGQPKAAVTENVTLPDLSYGSHNLTAYATDAAGNTGVSETVCFAISEETEAQPTPPPEHEPFPADLVIASVVTSATVVGAGLIVYFKKRKRSETT